MSTFMSKVSIRRPDEARIGKIGGLLKAEQARRKEKISSIRAVTHKSSLLPVVLTPCRGENCLRLAECSALRDIQV